MESFSRNHILLIDDDFEVLQVLQMSLEHAGFDVHIAGSTVEAELLLLTERFDLVVCDVTMPVESGYEFKARMMLKDLSLPPFLFSSGAPDFQLPSHIAEGVAGFLPKPYTIQELINTIRMVIPFQFAGKVAVKMAPLPGSL